MIIKRTGLIISSLLICLLFSATGYAEHPSSFRKAKKIAAQQIYHDYRSSFYCGCLYHEDGKRLTPDHQSCGYKPRKNENRAQRIEWEHVVPAYHFGHQRQCWQEGGRKNCTKNDPLFAKMEADLHNLVPAIGEVNGDRSNYRYGMIAGEERVYGRCDMEVNFKQRVAEPTENIRGDIARIYFYMRDQYQLKIASSQQKLLQAWANSDHVDEWECERERRINRVQGNGNPHVSSQCR